MKLNGPTRIADRLTGDSDSSSVFSISASGSAAVESGCSSAACLATRRCKLASAAAKVKEMVDVKIVIAHKVAHRLMLWGLKVLLV